MTNILDTKIKRDEIIAIKDRYESIIVNSRELENDFDQLIHDLKNTQCSYEHFQKLKNHLCTRIIETAEDEQRMNEESPHAPHSDGKSNSTRLFELKKKVEAVL